MNQLLRNPLVIAHRGASGYLPEHTLPAKAMAHAQGADFLEQDVVLTRDDVPIVLHDIHLDTTSDVADQFPGRARADGRFYAIDFTLAEIQQLNLSERFDPRTGQAVFPQRFPAHVGRFHIPTLAEELEFIQGLNRSTGRTAGIYPEIKQPAFHRQQGKEISAAVLSVLKKFGYDEPQSACYLQCFDPQELQRVRHELGCRLKMIQLLEEGDCQQLLATSEQLTAGLQRIAGYAQGIGPSLTGVFHNTQPTNLVEAAHQAGLCVHPWTYRADALVAGFTDFAQLHRTSCEIGVDGVFSDFPDRSRELMSCSQSAACGASETISRRVATVSNDERKRAP